MLHLMVYCNLGITTQSPSSDQYDPTATFSPKPLTCIQCWNISWPIIKFHKTAWDIHALTLLLCKYYDGHFVIKHIFIKNIPTKTMFTPQPNGLPSHRMIGHLTYKSLECMSSSIKIIHLMTFQHILWWPFTMFFISKPTVQKNKFLEKHSRKGER